MPSNYLQIIQEIGRYIAKAENAGRVHLLIRPIQEQAKLKELLFDEDQKRICGWLVTRESYRDEQLTNIENQRVSTFVLRGYYGHEEADETELAFQQWVDDVAGAFRPQDSLDGTCETIYPVQARVLSHVTIGDALCHYCELTFDVQELFGSVLPSEPVGPIIEITAPDASDFAQGFLTATVTWGDGEQVDCFALARMTTQMEGLLCYIKGEWTGEYFDFYDVDAAQDYFQAEAVAAASVTFTVYAIDSNGMVAVATKTITLAE